LVDIFDKLPVPFGLVRFGVAPDHPEVKVIVYYRMYNREQIKLAAVQQLALSCKTVPGHFCRHAIFNYIL